MSDKWTAVQIPSQTGRTVIVTGANSGLGRSATRELARAGAHVVMAVRSTEKGRATADEIARGLPYTSGEIEVRELDLADLSSVMAFAESWDGPLDVLVNNAGIMATPPGKTADGFEIQFGTNHLGHFALTNLLLPHITDRVVTVSSVGHRFGRIELDDLNWERRPYKPWPAYGQSKLANLLFTLELQRRLQAGGSPVRATAAHPGFAATNLIGSMKDSPVNKIMHAVTNRLAQSEDMGALPVLYAAVSDLPGASYVGPNGFREQRGYPTLVGRSALASDPEMAKKLWTASEALTGVAYSGPT